MDCEGWFLYCVHLFRFDVVTQPYVVERLFYVIVRLLHAVVRLFHDVVRLFHDVMRLCHDVVRLFHVVAEEVTLCCCEVIS